MPGSIPDDVRQDNLDPLQQLPDILEVRCFAVDEKTQKRMLLRVMTAACRPRDSPRPVNGIVLGCAYGGWCLLFYDQS